MGKDPAFLLYYKDWLSSTRFMKPEDKGYFIDLLCYQAEMGSIPEDIILQILPAENWQNLCKKFTKDRQGFYNKMQREFLNKRKKFAESRRNNGLKGGRPPKASEEPSGKASANHTEDAIEDAKEAVNGDEIEILGNQQKTERELLEKLKIEDEELPF